MYLNEVEDEQTRDDLALIIEEMLKQRIEGVKNRLGVPITYAFPKLILCLDEHIMSKESKYHYLLRLAAECTSKRLVPDYVSEKVMKELKINQHGIGDVYPPMGCLDYNERILIAPSHTNHAQKEKSQMVKIGDLFEHIVFDNNNSSTYKDSKLLNRAKNISDPVEKEKFLKHGYILYSGDHFNQWALQFQRRKGRKPTRYDFKELVGVVWDRDFIMNQRGADLSLVSKWDSYLECKVCDLLNKNGCRQIYTLDDNEHNQLVYIRNKFFTCLDDSRKQIDIFFPKLNIGFEINDFTTHDRYSDNIKYKTTGGLVVHTHDYQGFKKGPSYSKEKNEKFKEIGIEVFEIWEDEIRSGSFLSIINKVLNTDFVFDTDADNKIEESNIFDVNNSKSICFDLEKNGIIKYVEDIDGSFTKIKKIMRNNNITNWLKISTPHRNFTLTSDHPLIIETGQVVAGELRKGDYILNKKGEREFIINIEKINKIDFSYDIETESNTFVFSGVQSHNCRSFLTPDRVKDNLANAKNYKEGKGKYYGRANIGVSTLNLPYIAWLAKEKAEDKESDVIEEFYKQLEKYAELCHDMQRIRAERLSKTRAEVAPILWVDGALARLKPEDTLDKLVHNGYMTSSLGYSGLYETVKILSGENHWDKGHDLAIEIMQTLNDYTNKWKQEENIDYSIYGTPMESGTFKFANACKERFGDDIFQELDNHDRYYITNSVHIPVFHEIDPFTKLSIESEYQNLSPGGNIIYVEVSDLTKNLEALEQVIEHIYNTCMYAEINTETSYCHICGANNSIHLHGNGLDIKYICEHCGNEDESKMNFAVRVCGYLSTNSFNQGRAGDIKDRYKHLDTHVD